jgi:hypothetical protein
MAPFAIPNGDNEPKTLQSNGIPLTEYSANISPVREKLQPSTTVPSDYLLPDGYPDVSDKISQRFINTCS